MLKQNTVERKLHLNLYHNKKLNIMNYMINDNASRIVAIEFAKWVVLNGMWQSDLSFEEQYECWMKELDDVAYDDRVAHDSIDADHECWVDEMDGTR